MDQREQIAAIVIALAEYYREPLSEMQLAMYVEDLLELDADQLVAAVIAYRRDPKNDRFPLPARLRSMVLPSENLEADGREAASRIATAVSRIGPYQTDHAREFIGTLGWEVVRRQGGWEETCKALTYDNATTMQAQWRELAIAVGRRSRIGLLDTPPELPRPAATTGQLRSFGALISQMKPEDKK